LLLSLAAKSRLTVLTAGHERKHNACRAEVGSRVSGYTYIRRIEYVGKLERRLLSGTSKYSSTQAQGKQARDRRAEAVCSRCSSSGGRRQISRWSLVCVRGQERKWPADMLAQNRCKVLGASPRKAQVESGMVSEQTFTRASEAGKAHCAANAKAACAAISSRACVRQALNDKAV